MALVSYLETPPLSLYLHLPWCLKKCPYCDFNSHAVTDEVDFDRYVDALIADLDFERSTVGERPVGTVFIGGGTPSLFPASAIGRLLDAVRGILNCGDRMEITLEVNPGAVEADRFSAYRKIGVNRLSLGVQSFDDVQLAALGRVHDSTEARRALRIARDTGFDNINIDLMFGLPGQRLATALDDLELAISAAPEHISYYQLTLEPNTLFFNHPPRLPNDEAVWAIQEAGQSCLRQAGYHQYEVSAYAREGRECRHNMNYWTFGDYLGIGAGAHSKHTALADNRVWRSWRVRSPGQYQRLAGDDGVLGGQQLLTDADLVLEFVMNALRLNLGFEMELFQRRTGLAQSALAAGIGTAVEQGLLLQEAKTYLPSSTGRRFLNDLIQCFMD